MREKRRKKLKDERQKRGKTGRRRWIEVERCETEAFRLDAASESLRSE